MACLAGALLVVVAVVASRADNSNVSVSLPARFEIDPSAYRIQGAGGAAVDARIEDAGGNVRVTRPPVTLVTLPLVGVIGVLAVVLVVLHRLPRIFRRLVEGRPFLDENARSLRFIGLAVVAGELALEVGMLAREYGFSDIDGTQPPSFRAGSRLSSRTFGWLLEFE